MTSVGFESTGSPRHRRVRNGAPSAHGLGWTWVPKIAPAAVTTMDPVGRDEKGGSPMRVLVTCGSKRGGTEELAQMVADGLREEGHAVSLFRPDEVKHLDHFDAVVVGGAVYVGRWHKSSRQFVRRHAKELRKLPTFFFSSGPLDDSATKKEIPPVTGSGG
jgi:hypothetical protein